MKTAHLHRLQMFTDAYAARVHNIRKEEQANDYEGQASRRKPVRTEERPRQDIDGPVRHGVHFAGGRGQ